MPRRTSHADPLDVVREAVRTMPSSGRYGRENVFISEIWDRVGRRLGMSLEQFKHWLAHQNQQQNLALARADLVDDMDPEQVERSEFEHLGAQFHFVLDRSNRSGREEGRIAAAASARASDRTRIEREIADVVRGTGARLYYPGGDGGGGDRRSRKTAIPVVLPHAKTSRGCKLCSKFHTTAEHKRHARSAEGVKKGKSSSAGAGRDQAEKGAASRRRLGPADLVHPAKRMPLHAPKPKKSAPRRKLGPADLVHPTAVVPLEPARHASRTTEQVVLDAVRDMPPSGRFGPDKVFVSEIWDRVGQDVGMSLNGFKEWLVEANRRHALTLARADLVGAMDPEKVRKSEIDSRGATFHFVLDRDAQRW